MKNTNDLQWFCFVSIDHQVPEKWLLWSEPRYRTLLAIAAARAMLESRFFHTGVSCGPLTRSAGLISKRRWCFSASHGASEGLPSLVS
jgi:hypothetical protein